MIDKTKPIAALFDLDGVVLDTETQYSIFWKKTCKDYLGDENIALKVKGNTLEYIYNTFFSEIKDKQQEITQKLDYFEAHMEMNYIPGVQAFIADLKANNIKTAVVTSSNKPKMQTVFKNHPEILQLFDKILTAEMFAKSKPFPDPYLLGAKVFETVQDNCFVFEDSFNGLKSGRSANMTVIGIATTNSPDSIKPYSDLVVNDFTELDYQKLIALKG